MTTGHRLGNRRADHRRHHDRGKSSARQIAKHDLSNEEHARNWRVEHTGDPGRGTTAKKGGHLPWGETKQFGKL